MKNLLVSVIIPVYNASNYIENMVSCLKKQTYSNIEFIFINDGSTDSSLEILKLSTKGLKNSHIYSYQNAGAATARNRGLDASKGDIICFLDCDDEICENYVENLIKPFLIDNDVDISICGYKKRFLNKKTKVFSIANKNKFINKKRAIKYIFNKHHTNMIVPWAKAIRKDVFDIRFPDVRCEDEAISYQLFLKCKKISLIPDVSYIYIEREFSDSKNDNFNKIIDVCNIYYNRFVTLEKANICKYKAFYEFAFTYFGYFHAIRNNEKKILHTINNIRIKNVSHCLLSFKILRFVLLFIRYKFDGRGLQNGRISK